MFDYLIINNDGKVVGKSAIEGQNKIKIPIITRKKIIPYSYNALSARINIFCCLRLFKSAHFIIYNKQIS